MLAVCDADAPKLISKAVQQPAVALSTQVHSADDVVNLKIFPAYVEMTAALTVSLQS